MVVTVALTFAPEAVIELGRLREARRLRGRPVRGVAALRGLALPVLEGGLDRAVALAASMDSRGYGRAPGRVGRAPASGGGRHRGRVCWRWRSASTALADAGAPGALGLPLVGLGAVGLAVGLFVAGRRAVRTRYRPDPWRLPEWVVGASGVVAAGGDDGGRPAARRRRGAEPVHLAAEPGPRVPGPGRGRDPGRRWSPAVAAPRPVPAVADDVIRFDQVGFTYPDAAGPGPGRGGPDRGRRRAVPGGGPHRLGQVDPAARGQRAGAPLHRRAAHRAR